MSFSQYPEYTDSELEWLGEVPTHWKVRKVSYDFSAVKGPRGATLTKEYCSANPGLYPVYSGQTENAGVLGSIDNFDFSLGSNGGLLTTTVGAKAMSLTFVVDDISLSQNCMLIRPLSKDVFIKFYFYHLQPLFRLERGMIPDHMQPSFRMEDLYSFYMALPPLQEQTQIAHFLDHETAKIDTLVHEQKRLIELLKEKRQAVISHAVTKGLDPDVPMKDSGVEWVGEVPDEWEVTPLRYLGDCQNGINIAGDAFGSGFPFIGYGHVYKNDVLPLVTNDLVQSSQQDRERYSVQRGDVFFTRTSETVDEIGFSATCFHDIDSAVFAGFLIRFRPVVPYLLPEFSRYYFSNQRLREFFNKEMNLVTRASLSQDLLKKMVVTLPPVQEQSSISSHLDQLTGKVSSLICEARASIELLVERRSALISAAVTGKIDVRDWQPPESESASDEKVRQAGMETTA